MTLSAFRLQSCQWALRGGCRRYPCGGALPLQFANCSPAKALFEKSTSALLRNFKHALRITQMSRLIRSKRRLPYKPFKTGDTSLKNLTVSGFPYLKSVTELPLYPNVVPAPAFSAALFRSAFRESCHRKIISHSDGHSVVIGKTKKPIHRDIKNRREFFSRFKMMFYVTALKFKDGTVCSSVHSLTVPKSIECRRRYFLLAYRRHWAAVPHS